MSVCVYVSSCDVVLRHLFLLLRVRQERIDGRYEYHDVWIGDALADHGPSLVRLVCARVTRAYISFAQHQRRPVDPVFLSRLTALPGHMQLQEGSARRMGHVRLQCGNCLESRG